jgi:hypothetical protein
MNPTPKSCTAAFLWPALLALTLNACSAVGSLGAESFTLEGELPADFSLKAQAHYGAAGTCNGGSQTKTFKADFDSEPHGYRFRIPVSYRDGICDMQLARVGLFIHGRYGDKDWQQTYDNGGLAIVDQLPASAPAFQSDGTLSRIAECSWLFQESKLNLEISKILNCANAGAYLARDKLPNYTVNLSFKLDPEELPYRDNTWIKFPEGWRPCLPKEGWQGCQDPPVFKTYRNNNRECTIYPNCTE